MKMKWNDWTNNRKDSAVGRIFSALGKRTVLVTAIAMSTVAMADSNPPTLVEGVAVTGFNRWLGEPVMELGNLGTFGFDTVAVFNADGNVPEPLTGQTPDSALLATMVDETFLESFYGDEPFQVNPQTVNVPLRDVPTSTTPFYEPFFTLKGALDTRPYQLFVPGQTEPVAPITLGKWKQARGMAIIQCTADGEASVDLIMGGLIPNRIYTVWGFFLPSELTLPLKDFGPVLPLGGVPNVVVSDKNGSGRFNRILNFCPTDIEEEEVPLANIFVVYHSDLMANGGVPTFPERSRFPGTSAHVQLQFSLN